jgi:FixJ family two-component response regulator
MSSVEDSTVFVVEDEPETRESFAALVSTLGIGVEAFASGKEFLQRVDAERPGCAVVDFRLDGMDGLELHRRLVAAGCKLPVILISAYLTVQATAVALKQGVFHVLEKPYHNDELAAAIQDAIERDRSRRKQKSYRLDLEHRLASLDVRERRTLDLILAGNANKLIERKLELSQRTVARVRSAILAKTGFLSFVELSTAYGETKAADDLDSGGSLPAAGRHLQSAPVSVRADETAADPSVQDDGKKWRLLCCDLHDGAAQYLSATLRRLQAIEAQHEVAPSARPHLHRAEALLEVALRDIRDIVAGQSPTCSRQAGVISSVRCLVEELAGAAGINIELAESLGRRKLPAPLETAVYRMLQECLHNAIRHSGSDRVRVEISAESETLRLEVRDWGRGLDPDAVTIQHRGLWSIRERAELLGGRVWLTTEPGWGTRVAIELPLGA